MNVALYTPNDTRREVENNLRNARRDYYLHRRSDVTRLVVAALPTATHIMLGTKIFNPNNIWVEALHDADDTALWRTGQTPSPLEQFRYLDGAAWDEAVRLIVDTLGENVVWDHVSSCERTQRGSSDLYRIPLDRTSRETYTARATTAYVHAALHDLPESGDITSLTPEAWAQAYTDCSELMEALPLTVLNAERLGHVFYLVRTGADNPCWEDADRDLADLAAVAGRYPATQLSATSLGWLTFH